MSATRGQLLSIFIFCGLKTNTVLILGTTLTGLILNNFATSSAQAPEAFTIISDDISLFNIHLLFLYSIRLILKSVNINPSFLLYCFL